jgi:hypothetical protein
MGWLMLLSLFYLSAKMEEGEGSRLRITLTMVVDAVLDQTTLSMGCRHVCMLY